MGHQDIKNEILKAFSKIIDAHPSSYGRQYPKSFKTLTQQAVGQGISIKEIRKLVDISYVTLRKWTEHPAAPSVRLIQVVKSNPKSSATMIFPSGVTVKLPLSAIINILESQLMREK